MSAQELTSCRRDMGCSGGDARAAFYYMKYQGISRELCADYRMRCFVDNSRISVAAADQATDQRSAWLAAPGPLQLSICLFWQK